jgi:hypothetical protein
MRRQYASNGPGKRSKATTFVNTTRRDSAKLKRYSVFYTSLVIFHVKVRL